MRPNVPRKPQTGPKPRPALATAKVVYAYEAQDADELSMNAGDVIEIIQEGKRIFLQLFYRIVQIVANF